METFSMSRKEVPRAGLLKALVLLRRTQADDVSETIARRIGNASPPPTPFDNDGAPAYRCQPNDWSRSTGCDLGVLHHARRGHQARRAHGGGTWRAAI